MSEEKAESLYGAAPEGDEDPHASQAVPDPGESRSYTSMNHVTFEALYLSGAHLGLNVRIQEEREGYRFGAYGLLTSVKHEASIIDDKTLGGKENLVLGQRWVIVTFGSHSGTRLRADATVELLD